MILVRMLQLLQLGEKRCLISPESELLDRDGFKDGEGQDCRRARLWRTKNVFDCNEIW